MSTESLIDFDGELLAEGPLAPLVGHRKPDVDIASGGVLPEFQHLVFGIECKVRDAVIRGHAEEPEGLYGVARNYPVPAYPEGRKDPQFTLRGYFESYPQAVYKFQHLYIGIRFDRIKDARSLDRPSDRGDLLLYLVFVDKKEGRFGSG
ncbi:MAG: hypothetical protein P8013_01965 [Candidatus Sulfobium sp.]